MARRIVEEKVNKVIFTCDKCGKESSYHGDIRTCTHCGKDFCKGCGEYWDDNSDYPPFYCAEHYNKYIIYHEEKVIREEKLEKELEILYNNIMSDKFEVE